jgi:hypothetical protein
MTDALFPLYPAPYSLASCLVPNLLLGNAVIHPDSAGPPRPLSIFLSATCPLATVLIPIEKWKISDYNRLQLEAIGMAMESFAKLALAKDPKNEKLWNRP